MVYSPSFTEIKFLEVREAFCNAHDSTLVDLAPHQAKFLEQLDVGSNDGCPVITDVVPP